MIFNKSLVLTAIAVSQFADVKHPPKKDAATQHPMPAVAIQPADAIHAVVDSEAALTTWAAAT